ncbi:hypothetical protein [Amycolatopsis suaedae]|uniref:Uncharacterized protein n=1 Tax=Amycolatopsis suaedae TaxID=2510978 RepID=A0A4Q7J0G6_9PSEU|nr:hypothetical protein [Amycolatopsis suaedae]RZQ59424.1 hypothetical protein EWH70_34505 [Amycolatopsis suaedae]
MLVPVTVWAGLLVTLAPMAAAAGWWLLAAGVLACLLVAVAPAPDHPVRHGVSLAARWAVVPLVSAAFAAYLVPGHQPLAEAGFVVAASLLAVAAGRLRHGGLVAVGVLTAATLALVAVGLAVEPVDSVPGPVAGPAGVPLAAALAVPLLAGARRWWLAVGVLLAVGAVALYQLGPVRLGLSVTAPADLLGAADAAVLRTGFGAVIVLAVVAAAVAALRSTGTGPSWWPVAGGAAAVPAALLLDPLASVQVAAVVVLAEILVGAVVELRSGLAARPAVAAAGALGLLATLPLAAMVIGAAVALLGVAAHRYRIRYADTG